MCGCVFGEGLLFSFRRGPLTSEMPLRMGVMYKGGSVGECFRMVEESPVAKRKRVYAKQFCILIVDY